MEATNTKPEDFYTREFRGSIVNTTLTCGELEELPCPFCTDDVSDQTMQDIIDDTEMDTIADLGLTHEPSLFDFENDRHSEKWWENLEAACIHHNVPYYEDMEE